MEHYLCSDVFYRFDTIPALDKQTNKVHSIYRVVQKCESTKFEGSSSAYIFKTPEVLVVFMIFGTLQRRLILNTSVNSKFIKYIVQSGATWRYLTTRVLLSTNAKGSSA